jgi:folate-dependent phosphoribosylglycinamide formyltransferase PurN
MALAPLPEGMRAFLIVTTRDLPEAYFLAASLEAREQRIAVVNIAGRPFATKLRVLRRLRRNRGTRYLADLLLGRMVRTRYLPATIVPFPEIDAGTIARSKRRWLAHTCRDPHAPATLQFVRDFDPDYMLLAGTPVLKPALYSLARHGALNRHLGMLPEYKGSDCPVWALASNDPERLGFSIHRVAEKVDAGDIVHLEHVPIALSESFVGYITRLQRRASEAFVNVLDRVVEGSPIEARPQMVQGRFFPPAGLRALRQARRNFDRLTQASGDQPSSERVAA